MPNAIKPLLVWGCYANRYKTYASLMLPCQTVRKQCLFSLVAMPHLMKPTLFLGCNARRYKTNAFESVAIPYAIQLLLFLNCYARLYQTNAFLRLLCQTLYNPCFSCWVRGKTTMFFSVSTRSPTRSNVCQWKNGECRFEGNTLNDLVEHISSTHIQVWIIDSLMHTISKYVNRI